MERKKIKTVSTVWEDCGRLVL